MSVVLQMPLLDARTLSMSIFIIDSRGFLHTAPFGFLNGCLYTSQYHTYKNKGDVMWIYKKATDTFFAVFVTDYCAYWSNTTSTDLPANTTTYYELIHVLSTLNEWLNFTEL